MTTLYAGKSVSGEHIPGFFTFRFPETLSPELHRELIDMKDGGRLSAAIEILEQVLGRSRPVHDTMQDWGKGNRYAGSKDRHSIRSLVLDALRQKQSISWRMGSEEPRSLILGAYSISWNNGLDKLQETLSGDRYSPEKLSDSEIKAITDGNLEDAPDHVKADVPEWLWPSFVSNFNEEAVNEGRGLALEPPVDMRVNTLKSTRDKALKQLSKYNVEPTPISPVGMRIRTGSDSDRPPRVTSEPGYQKGRFELQDESSQIASILVNAKPGDQVLDFCAGGGGKTLALAAEMQNKGQIYAFDSDKNRLAPIHQRLVRAGVRNVQVRQPGENPLSDLESRMDCVIVDAPCSGTGVWRRRPDAKWRITENALVARIAEQESALQEASVYVRKGGCMVYATCSVLPEENEQQVYAFSEGNPEFEIVSLGEVWQDRFGFEVAKPWSVDMKTITLTPASTGTDGFFLAVLIRNCSD